MACYYLPSSPQLLSKQTSVIHHNVGYLRKRVEKSFMNLFGLFIRSLWR